MLPLAVIALPLWAYILTGSLLVVSGAISGGTLAFVMWLENKWFAASIAGGILIALVSLFLFFRVLV